MNGQGMGQKRNAQGFGGETNGKRPVGRPRCGWEGSIKVDIKEILWKGMDWILLAMDRKSGRLLCTQ